jgi:hypothetical protein
MIVKMIVWLFIALWLASLLARGIEIALSVLKVLWIIAKVAWFALVTWAAVKIVFLIR